MRAALLVGAIVLTRMLVGPGAEASDASRHSTSCAFVATLKFKPGLVHGVNRLAFIKFKVHLTGCTGRNGHERARLRRLARRSPVRRGAGIRAGPRQGDAVLEHGRYVWPELLL